MSALLEPADPFPSLAHRFNRESAKAAAQRSNVAQAARREAIANAARLAAETPNKLAQDLTIACAETLIMLRSTSDPRDKAYLAKALRDLKAASVMKTTLGATPPRHTPALPPPTPLPQAYSGPETG